jgi:3-hydroxyacyl-[acyl-carrier-protein] dehydratase
MMDIKDILKVLPHRYPFLLVDRVLEIDEENKKITAIKNVTINEPFFQGHFPGDPIMPGVLIVEALAQTSGLLGLHLLGHADGGKLILFMGIDKVKFRHMVTPGDQLRFEATLTRPGSKVNQFEVAAYVGEKMAAQGILTAMVTDKPED